MKTYIALLRGINVGGKNMLPMKELAALLAGLDLADVKTYLNSGNVVFRSQETDANQLTEAITAAIGQQFGFTPWVLVRSIDQLQAAIAANPFPEGEDAPKALHFYFLESAPLTPDLASLEAVKTASERYRLIDAVFYLHAPDGIGRSKLAAKVEKALGVPATARNWRTVSKVLALAEMVT